MECRVPLHALSGRTPQPLAEPCMGQHGERITHRLVTHTCGSEVDLFCTGACRGRFFAKRSGLSIRKQLFELERGICQRCGLDCLRTLQEVKACGDKSRRATRLAELAPRIAAVETLASRALGRLTEGSIWEADHIVPVWAGGGACGLENLQTLCVACHRAKTSAEVEPRMTTLDPKLKRSCRGKSACDGETDVASFRHPKRRRVALPASSRPKQGAAQARWGIGKLRANGAAADAHELVSGSPSLINGRAAADADAVCGQPALTRCSAGGCWAGGRLRQTATATSEIDLSD